MDGISVTSVFICSTIVISNTIVIFDIVSNILDKGVTVVIFRYPNDQGFAYLTPNLKKIKIRSY